MLKQRRRRCADVVQIIYKWFVFVTQQVILSYVNVMQVKNSHNH